MTGRLSHRSGDPTSTRHPPAQSAALAPAHNRRIALVLAAIASIVLSFCTLPPTPNAASTHALAQSTQPQTPVAPPTTSAPDTPRPAAPVAARTLAEIESDVLAEVAAIEAFDDPDARSSAFDDLADHLDTEVCYRLLSRASAAPATPPGPELTRRMLRRLAADDPHTLEQWARTLPEDVLRTDALVAVALHHSDQNRLEALDWAQRLGGAPSEVAAAIQVATEAAGIAPTEALDLAARLPASPARDQCLAFCVAQWAAIDPTGSAAWTATIPNVSLRTLLLNRVVTAMATADPVTAANWTADALPPGTLQSRTAVAVAQRWAQRDPQAAQSWVDTFDDSRLRSCAATAIDQTAGGQAQADPAPGD